MVCASPVYQPATRLVLEANRPAPSSSSPTLPRPPGLLVKQNLNTKRRKTIAAPLAPARQCAIQCTPCHHRQLRGDKHGNGDFGHFGNLTTFVILASWPRCHFGKLTTFVPSATDSDKVAAFCLRQLCSLCEVRHRGDRHGSETMVHKTCTDFPNSVVFFFFF